MIFVEQFLAAALGTVAFALLFGVPRQYYLYCGLIGGAGWIFYYTVQPLLGATGTTFLAAVLVIFLSRVCAVHYRCPVTIFLISGIIPLVPGAGIYWSAFYLVTNQLGKASVAGFAAVKAAVAIVLGIVCVFELPQGFFRFAKAAEDRKPRSR